MEAPRPLDEQQPPSERAAESLAPTYTTPREVDELKLRYPHFNPVLEAAEAALAIENRDPIWSPAMEARILGEISQKALGLEINNVQVECRATLCRVVVVFPHTLLQKRFGVVPAGTVWNGKQPVNFFLEALDLEFRQPIPGGLDAYGTPIVVGYVERSPVPSPALTGPPAR